MGKTGKKSETNKDTIREQIPGRGPNEGWGRVKGAGWKEAGGCGAAGADFKMAERANLALLAHHHLGNTRTVIRQNFMNTQVSCCCPRTEATCIPSLPYNVFGRPAIFTRFQRDRVHLMLQMCPCAIVPGPKDLVELVNA